MPPPQADGFLATDRTALGFRRAQGSPRSRAWGCAVVTIVLREISMSTTENSIRPADTGPSFALKPVAVTIRVAQKLLGDKSRSLVYEAVGRKELDAVKDGN